MSSISAVGARFSFAFCAGLTTIMSSRPSTAVRSLRLKMIAPVRIVERDRPEAVSRIDGDAGRSIAEIEPAGAIDEERVEPGNASVRR